MRRHHIFFQCSLTVCMPAPLITRTPSSGVARADGSVFLCRQKSSGRQCVMKRMQLSTLNDKERRSALQEAQLLQSLTHPNVVAYVDMHATRSKLFLFMQYCDGGDLEQRINGHKKAGTHVTETQLLDWFVQMALALQYLHDSRSAHTVPQPSRPTLAPLRTCSARFTARPRMHLHSPPSRPEDSQHLPHAFEHRETW